MKKKRFRKRRHRNATAIPNGTKPRRRFRFRPPRRSSRPPDWKTTLAAIAGGAGGAALGGLVVNQQILSPEAVGIGMMGIGGATAYFSEGNTRTLANSVAAAGAGQLALALMAKRALAAVGGIATPTTAPQLPPAAPPVGIGSGTPTLAAPPRRSASDGGVVIDLFRDAARELDQLEEDEMRFSTRDADISDVELYDIDLDLDEAA